jgi:hypothetical protein
LVGVAGELRDERVGDPQRFGEVLDQMAQELEARLRSWR